jgi:uncharacterized protein YqeY
MTLSDGESLRDRLRRALPAAMKARDRVAVDALRSALAAIDNAQAVDPSRSPPAAAGPEPGGPAGGHPMPAGTVVGVGATEVERRSLTEAQMEEIVRAEIAEREAASAGYQRAGQLGFAERLRGEAQVLTSHLDMP